MALKTKCEGLDAIRAAYLHYIVGLTQAEVAAALDISNHGRVNEAVKAIGSAAGVSDAGYKGQQGGEDD